MKTTIRRLLNEVGFDWENGKIIHQISRNFSWNRPTGAEVLEDDSILLDMTIDGLVTKGPKCPRFIAKDNSHIYFPILYGYRGEFSIFKVSIDIDAYLDFKTNWSPYVKL